MFTNVSILPMKNVHWLTTRKLEILSQYQIMCLWHLKRDIHEATNLPMFPFHRWLVYNEFKAGIEKNNYNINSNLLEPQEG